MRILIAEDDSLSRKLLETALEESGHQVLSHENGESALETFMKSPTFELAILDWMMPGMDGLELCKEIKANSRHNLTYVIMLTAKSSPEDLALAINSGADDFIVKPFNTVELNARIYAGIRMVRLQRAMIEHICELQEALAHVGQLQDILPICSGCKKIRDDNKYWSSVENYISKYSQVKFSHAICPECFTKKYPDLPDSETTTEKKSLETSTT